MLFHMWVCVCVELKLRKERKLLVFVPILGNLSILNGRKQNVETWFNFWIRNSNLRFIFVQSVNKADWWKNHLTLKMQITYEKNEKMNEQKEIAKFFVDCNWKCFRLAVILWHVMITRSNFDSRKIEHISITHLISYGSVPWPHSHTGNCCCSSLFFFFRFVRLQQIGALFRLYHFQLTHCSLLLYNRLWEGTFISWKFERTYNYKTGKYKRQTKKRVFFIVCFKRRWLRLIHSFA